jgi:serine/threonine protein phosphatase PrpC
MNLAVRSVAQSHVGLVRQGNEDSGYAGPRLLVVADGMGGHAAGEVASAVTVEALAVLDGPGPAPEDMDADEALTNAIATANQRIRDLVDSDPRRSGMGTTVTALLWTGQGFSLAHIGDSRAYLLRDGELVQLTRDHTYVQALIDEGRINEQERETHPARSLLLQALGGDDVVPDLGQVDALDGDRLMLCSDGLSGVVHADEIARVLAETPDSQQAADALVQMAVEGGGPDNITCVVADVRASSHVGLDDDTTEAHLVGAASIGAAHPDALRYDDEEGPVEPTAAAGAPPHEPDDPTEVKAVDDDEVERYAPRHRSRTRIAVAVVLAVLAVVLVVLGYRLGSAWYDQQYFVGVDGEDVVIRQGVPGIPGSAVVSTVPDLPLTALPEVYQENLTDGIRADDITDAGAIAERVRREACRANNAGPQISGFPGLDCSSVNGGSAS